MANKQYNLNTKYGRKKAREQAQHNYDNGTPEYKNEVDQMKGCAFAILVLVAILFGILIYLTKGEAGLKSWMK